MSDAYEELTNWLKDKGCTHGVGMGKTVSSVDIAQYYMLKGVGEYELEDIHKFLLPNVIKVRVNLAWRKEEEWRKNVPNYNSEMFTLEYNKVKEELFPGVDNIVIDLDDDKKKLICNTASDRIWKGSEGDPDSTYHSKYMMVDVHFIGEAIDGCTPTEDFGFQCICTDHGGTISGGGVIDGDL